jgi:hypothetical protein
METVRLVILQPEGQPGPIVELAPLNVNNRKEAEEYWRRNGEFPQIVIDYLDLSVSDEVVLLVEEVREDWIDTLEDLLTALYRAALQR